jgi:hypothetical protein
LREAGFFFAGGAFLSFLDFDSAISNSLRDRARHGRLDRLPRLKRGIRCL